MAKKAKKRSNHVTIAKKLTLAKGLIMPHGYEVRKRKTRKTTKRKK